MNLDPDEGHVAKLRSAGFLTKGIVYFLVGTLTLMAAFKLGGDITSTDGAVRFLLTLPFGKVLGAVISIGLTAYILWRLYQMLFLPGTYGPKNVKNTFKRFRFLYSGIFYGIIAYSFAEPLLTDFSELRNTRTSSSSNSSEEKAALWELLSTDWGSVIIWVLALVVAGQAIWQFKLAYSAKFLKKIDHYPDVPHEYDLIRKAGRMGYTARGLVFGILSFFLIKVVVHHNANIYSGTQGALQYLLSFSYGDYLLGATAVGLISYGVFNIMVARHADLTTLQ